MVDVSEISIRGLHGRVHASMRPAEATPAPVFVLIHGIGASHRYFKRLHHALAQVADTYSFDLPGFGGTPKPDHQLPVAEYAAFVLAALDQLRVESCVLVGHSMGAQVVVEAARLRPDLVTQLVLMGPVVDVRRRSFPRQAFDLALDSLLFENPGANWFVASDYVRCGPRWYLTELPVMMQYAIEDRITGVSPPVLVLRGGQDQVATERWCALLASLAPAGQFHSVPGKGHVVQHGAAMETAHMIQAFAANPDRPLAPPA